GSHLRRARHLPTRHAADDVGEIVERPVARDVAGDPRLGQGEQAPLDLGHRDRYYLRARNGGAERGDRPGPRWTIGADQDDVRRDRRDLMERIPDGRGSSDDIESSNKRVTQTVPVQPRRQHEEYSDRAGRTSRRARPDGGHSDLP